MRIYVDVMLVSKKIIIEIGEKYSIPVYLVLACPIIVLRIKVETILDNTPEAVI